MHVSIQNCLYCTGILEILWIQAPKWGLSSVARASFAAFHLASRSASKVTVFVQLGCRGSATSLRKLSIIVYCSSPFLLLCLFFFSSYYILITFCHFYYHLAVKPIASKHAYYVSVPIQWSSSLPFDCSGHLSFPSDTPAAFFKDFFLVCYIKILVNSGLTRGILFAHCAPDVALSPPHFPAKWLLLAPCLICLLFCFDPCLLTAVWENFCSINGRCPSSFKDKEQCPRKSLPRPALLQCLLYSPCWWSIPCYFLFFLVLTFLLDDRD